MSSLVARDPHLATSELAMQTATQIAAFENALGIRSSDLSERAKSLWREGIVNLEEAATLSQLGDDSDLPLGLAATMLGCTSEIEYRRQSIDPNELRPFHGLSRTVRHWPLIELEPPDP